MCKILVLAISLLSTYSFAGEQTPRFGVTLKTSSERACATFQGPELKVGQDILVATFDPPQWINGKITEIRSARCETPDDLSGVGYEVQLKQIENRNEPELGIAVVMTPAKKTVKSRRPVLFINVNEEPIIFHECASHEGVHLSAWQGKRRIWHEYYYLRYDVDPTCTEEEFEE